MNIKDAKVALEEIKKYNRINNDLESYLFAVANWGLGKEEKPIISNWGIEEVSSVR